MIKLNPTVTKTRHQKVKPRNIDIDAKGFKLAFSERTYIMGILNITPDSFSDGGMFIKARDALKHAEEMAINGADIIDVGGESTRPGSRAVELSEELDRVIPVIKRLSKILDVPISIDTRKSEVAEEAIKAGACIVNDVSGLRHDPSTARVVARTGAALIVMHARGSPTDMQVNPEYKDVVNEIIESLKESLSTARRLNVSEEKIIVDPGIGFGKTAEHNLSILNRLEELAVLERPICIGTSRKSFLGILLGKRNTGERSVGTLASCAIAVMNGANILRVHDVGAAKELAIVVDSIRNEKMN